MCKKDLIFALTYCRVSEAKFYLYHSTRIAKAGPGMVLMISLRTLPSRQILVVLAVAANKDYDCKVWFPSNFY